MHYGRGVEVRDKQLTIDNLQLTLKPKKGTMVILVVVLVLIIAIAIFVITGVLNLEKLQKDRNSSSLQNQEQSEVDTLSKSDEVNDIEADLNITTFDDLNSELTQIEKDLSGL